MRSRASSAHAEALARRLEQLSAELSGTPQPGAAKRHPPGPAAVTPYDEEWNDYTRIRPVSAFGPVPEPLVEAPPARTEAMASPTVSSPTVPSVPVPGRHAARRRGRWLDFSGMRGRVSLEPAHVALAAVLAAIGLGVTCWWVLADDAGEPLPTVPAPEGLVTPGAEQPAAQTEAATTEVVVDVVGKVRNPGIVVLEPGSRVVDAVDAAGGAKRGADLTGLNLARVLVDGEQIVVGEPQPPGFAASAAPSAAPGAPGATGALVNLNTASLAELDELPGVGPVTAQAIIDWRDANGGFRSVDQLLDVQGIGEKTLADLAPLVTL